jgi:hypothetical protein
LTVKGQLHACRDFLLVGMRAAARGSTPDEQAGRVLRACLDLVEQMVRQSESVTATEVETTLAVLNRAESELDQSDGSPNAVLASLRNAIGRLQLLRTEIAAK